MSGGEKRQGISYGGEIIDGDIQIDMVNIIPISSLRQIETINYFGTYARVDAMRMRAIVFHTLLITSLFCVGMVETMANPPKPGESMKLYGDPLQKDFWEKVIDFDGRDAVLVSFTPEKYPDNYPDQELRGKLTGTYTLSYLHLNDDGTYDLKTRRINTMYYHGTIDVDGNAGGTFGVFIAGYDGKVLYDVSVMKTREDPELPLVLLSFMSTSISGGLLTLRKLRIRQTTMS